MARQRVALVVVRCAEYQVRYEPVGLGCSSLVVELNVAQQSDRSFSKHESRPIVSTQIRR